jgi:hypothetical protein
MIPLRYRKPSVARARSWSTVMWVTETYSYICNPRGSFETAPSLSQYPGDHAFRILVCPKCKTTLQDHAQAGPSGIHLMELHATAFLASHFLAGVLVGYAIRSLISARRRAKTRREPRVVRLS